MDIKFIFFDFGGTIDSDGLHWRKRAYPIYLKYGIDISYDEFSKAFFDSDDNLHIRHDLSKSGFEQTVLLQVSDLLKFINRYDPTLAQRIADEFITESKKKVEENTPLFRYLKSRGIRLGIISNFYGNLEIVLQSLCIRNYFDVVVDSQAIGHIKPSKEIFQHALSEMKAKADLSAMVGDSFHRDIVGAHNMNMYHFYISEEGYEKKCCDKFFVIKNIRELIKYV